MRIDNVPNIWIAESMRSRFEREDTLAGVMGLHGWAMISWHNWRRIALWMGFIYFMSESTVLGLGVDRENGVKCSLPPYLPLEGSLSRLLHPGGGSLHPPGQGRHHVCTGCDGAALAGCPHLLRLITSFEPLFLMANFMAERTCWRIHAVSGRQHAKELALHDFGVAEWAYVILGATLHFSAFFPLICGFQDAFPDLVRQKRR